MIINPGRNNLYNMSWQNIDSKVRNEQWNYDKCKGFKSFFLLSICFIGLSPEHEKTFSLSLSSDIFSDDKKMKVKNDQEGKDKKIFGVIFEVTN